MNPYQKIQGVIIAKRNLKESDLLVTIFSKSLGKIICKARGVKSIKSRRLGSLELGNIVKAQLYTKFDFYHLTEVENLERPILESPNLAQISMLFYYFELLNILLPEKEPQPAIYNITPQTIKAIKEKKLDHFIKSEILLCQYLGFGPPPEIITSFNQKKYRQTQQLLNSYFQNLIQKPLQSLKLFK